MIGMGKLGGGELNYASDVDVRVRDGAVARTTTWREACRGRREALVPGGHRPAARRQGGSAHDEHWTDTRSYWGRWAETWEFQALIKARAVAGDPELGSTVLRRRADQVWDRTYSADELALIRRLKERSEAIVASRGLSERELKRGPGGIRDVEFAVQLLQLVHGRRDPSIRSRSTLEALGELAASGYVGTRAGGGFGECIPVLADRRAQAATRRGAADPHGAGRARRQGTARAGPRVRATCPVRPPLHDSKKRCGRAGPR